ncbi:hypothetical protein B0H14DRAFT_2586112 [Mycena olivaceomarginata]|nr:hypothetical protein B0H14DRAFT_2586112 [Mycena olivaceomarginata]
MLQNQTIRDFAYSPADPRFGGVYLQLEPEDVVTRPSTPDSESTNCSGNMPSTSEPLARLSGASAQLDLFHVVLRAPKYGLLFCIFLSRALSETSFQSIDPRSGNNSLAAMESIPSMGSSSHLARTQIPGLGIIVWRLWKSIDPCSGNIMTAMESLSPMIRRPLARTQSIDPRSGENSLAAMQSLPSMGSLAAMGSMASVENDQMIGIKGTSNV